MAKLKSCPFCGGKNIFIDEYKHSAGVRWRREKKEGDKNDEKL